MAMPYQARAEAARDGAFIDRIVVGAVKLAIYVAGEAGATPSHAERLVLANQVLAAPRAVAERLAVGVLTASIANGITTADDLTDANVQTALETIWNAYAGVAG